MRKFRDEMMIFQELLKETSWIDIKKELAKKYSLDETQLRKYQKIYFRLLSYKPKSNEAGITINIEKPKEEVDDYDVYGKNKNGEKFDLDFAPWDEWLGFRVNLAKFSKAEFVAICLWEMTFWGDEEDIEEKRNELKEILRKLDNKEYLTSTSTCPFCEGTGNDDGKPCHMCENGKITIIHFRK